MVNRQVDGCFKPECCNYALEHFKLFKHFTLKHFSFLHLASAKVDFLQVLLDSHPVDNCTLSDCELKQYAFEGDIYMRLYNHINDN